MAETLGMGNRIESCPLPVVFVFKIQTGKSAYFAPPELSLTLEPTGTTEEYPITVLLNSASAEAFIL